MHYFQDYFSNIPCQLLTGFGIVYNPAKLTMSLPFHNLLVFYGFSVSLEPELKHCLASMHVDEVLFSATVYLRHNDTIYIAYMQTEENGMHYSCLSVSSFTTCVSSPVVFAAISRLPKAYKLFLLYFCSSFFILFLVFNLLLDYTARLYLQTLNDNGNQMKLVQ